MDPLSLLFGVVGLFYILFMRNCNNALIAIFRNKDYVVVHIRKLGTRKVVVYNSMPNIKENFLTNVFSNKSYSLRPDEYNFEIKGRKHYIFNEEDNMPMKFRSFKDKIIGVKNSFEPEKYNPQKFDVSLVKENEKVFVYKRRLYFSCDDKAEPLKLDPRTADDYVVGARRVNQAMTSKSFRVLHEPQSQMIYIIAGVVFLIMAIVIIYGVMQYQQLSPLVNEIYARTIIQNQNTVIAPVPTVTPHP